MKDRREIRRQRLLELISKKFSGKQAALAEHVGIPANLISRYANGTKGIGEDMRSKIEKFCDLPEGWLDDKAGRRLAEIGTNAEEALPLRPFQNVPVVGTVQGGDQGYFIELDHSTAHEGEYITYPKKDHESYALRVRGDSMRPRIKNGEFIVVEPNHVPQPGDDVVVILTDGRKMVKELLYIRDGDIALGSINDGYGTITVPMPEVESIHYVAAIIPRGAFYKG